MKTKIIYFSKTGNIDRFVKKLNYNNYKKLEEDLILKEPFVLITSTINFGEVPLEVKKFLKNNHNFLVGVSGSGNRNWGSNFAKAADIISKKFNVPIINKFELSGNIYDVEIFNNKIKELNINNEY